MRSRLRLLSFGLAVLLAVPAAAEPLGSYFHISPFGGFTIFDGNLRFPGSNPLTDDLYLGGRLGYQYNSLWGLEAAVGFTPTREDVASGGTDVDFEHASGNLMLTPFSNRFGGPFVFVGGGAAQLKPSAGGAKKSPGDLEFGGGVRFWLTDALGVRLEARDAMFKLSGAGSNSNLSNIMIGGGIVLAMGARPRDTDGDGVPDRKDKCPDTPKGATVDAEGCPHDTDGDGVLDGLDKCPNTPKGCTVDASGCEHDSDGDGVCDGLDKCPDTPKGATVDATGCPHDSDGDGVLDGLDKCPNTQKGCTVDATGCPKDSDGDGVCDGLDKCPDTAPGLKVDANGCPIEVMEKETELLDTGMIRLQNVNFETAKADLMPDASAVLDVVGTVLLKWPELKIEIGGHTDNKGGIKYNQKLSEARVDSVRAYLVRKFPGLKPEQFTVKGYGKSKPLAPNSNELNMAKNRRVEFVVQNKDVLKREVERRSLLKKDQPAPAPVQAPPDTTKH